MRRKVLFFLFFDLFLLASSVSVVKAEISKYPETYLKNDPACWNYTGSYFQYNTNSCSIISEVAEGDHPDYCKVQTDGVIYQTIQTYDAEAAAYRQKTFNEDGISDENGQQKFTLYTCQCDQSGGSRVCHYKLVDGIENYVGKVCPSKTVKWYLVAEDGTTSEEQTYTGDFSQDGEEVCASDNGPVEICNLKTGEWKTSDGSSCKSDEKCFNYKENSSSSSMKAACKSVLIRKDVCSEDGKYVMEANDYGYQKVDLNVYFEREDCIKCRIENNEPTCQNSEDQIIGDCYKVGDVSLESGSSVDKSVCYNNQIYNCQEKTKPSYTPGEECTGSTPKCLDNADGSGKAKCVSEDEYNKYDHSEIGIDVSSDSNFFCSNTNEIQTALGCIPYSMSGLAEKLLPLLFGIAGGISFLLMVFGFIMMATSSGDEKKLIEARSRITSAITGLLVSIFAIFLFRLIFSNILKIPGL